MKKKPPKVEDFVQIRLLSILEQNPPLLVLFFSKSSTFGYENLKNLHFGSFFFLLDFLSKLEKPPLLVVFFSKVRISFRIDFQSSTFGGFFFSKILHFWLRKLSFLIPQSATRCKNTSKSLPSLFFWCPLPVLQVLSRLEHFDFFLFQGYPLCIIFRFWSLRPQQGASKLQNHFPAYFFDGPHQSCKFCPDWRTLNFF